MQYKGKGLVVKTIINKTPKFFSVYGLLNVVKTDSEITIEALVVDEVSETTFNVHSPLGARSLTPGGLDSVLLLRSC
ncbi:hypothetical protein CN918_32320 [Priestia megaterium]|nr:hypothetical protein CN918_32320 [Priestia megaterium]